MKGHPGVVPALSAVLLALTASCAPVSAALSTSPTPGTPVSALTPTALPPSPTGIRSGPAIPASPTPPTRSPFVSTEAPSPSEPASCPLFPCTVDGHFLLGRPIAPPGRDLVDPTYRFGSTQNGAREPHHGVEFVNSSGTPVLAAAAGEVVVAGDDRATIYAEWPYFYGNLVVLRHDLPEELAAEYKGPLYTLYAHLVEVKVAVGETVTRGQEIGRVGLSGVATGSHLHFEVRLGENVYASVQNPELWLEPRADEQGRLYGTLAGRLEAAGGQPLAVPNLVVERLTAPKGEPLWQLYVETYADPMLAGDPLWEENFALGDLPAGWYRVTFVARGLQVHELEVLPGRLTVMMINVDAPGSGTQ